jgi:hypothetical protein
MHAENLLIYQSGDRKAVEAVGEHLPQPNVVPPLALIIEAVNSVDGCTLVIAPEQKEILGVFDLVSQQ